MSHVYFNRRILENVGEDKVILMFNTTSGTLRGSYQKRGTAFLNYDANIFNGRFPVHVSLCLLACCVRVVVNLIGR